MIHILDTYICYRIEHVTAQHDSEESMRDVMSCCCFLCHKVYVHSDFYKFIIVTSTRCFLLHFKFYAQKSILAKKR